MGREVRRVPKDWKHPKDDAGRYKPLHDDYPGAMKWYLEWIKEHPKDTEEPMPRYHEHMPIWRQEKRTHYQMYETCSEGTPISPVMETPEELAQWLVNHHASSFAYQTASYDAWLTVCKGGWAPSAVSVNGQLMSGVEFAEKEDRDD